MTARQTRVPGFFQALAMVLMLIALPVMLHLVFGRWGLAAGLLASVIMLSFLRNWFMTEPRAKWLSVRYSIATIVLAGAAVFGLLPTAAASVQRHYNCAEGGVHWACDIALPTFGQRFLIFGAVAASVLILNFIVFRLERGPRLSQRAGDRGVNVAGDANAPVTTGDGNQINGRD